MAKARGAQALSGEGGEPMALEAVRAELAQLDDPHIHDLGMEGLRQISADDVRMYERYTRLKAQLDVKGKDSLDDQYWEEVRVLAEEVSRRQATTRSLKSDDPTVVFIAMIGTKIGGLDGYRQLRDYKKRKAAERHGVASSAG